MTFSGASSLYWDPEKDDYLEFDVEVPTTCYEYSVIIPGTPRDLFYIAGYQNSPTDDPKELPEGFYTSKIESLEFEGSDYTRISVTFDVWAIDKYYSSFIYVGEHLHAVNIVFGQEASSGNSGVGGYVADGPFDLSTLDNIDYFFISIPDSVKYVGDGAFSGGRNPLKSVEIGQLSELEYVGNYSFSNAGGNVFFSKNFYHMGECAFGSSVSITIDSDNSYYSIDQVGNLTSKDGKVLMRYHGTQMDYSIPDSVLSVMAYAFKGNDTIKTVTVRDGIEWGMFPFTETSITNIIFDEEMVEIPNYLFSGTSLEQLTIPKQIERIGTKSFYHIQTLESVTFEDGSKIQTIEPYAFSSNKKLESVVFGSSAVDCYCEIDEGAFYDCTLLANVIVDPSFDLRTIGKGAFAKDQGNDYGIELDAVSIRVDGSISSGKGIVIPSSVESIGIGAFANMSNGNGHDSSGIEPGYRMMNNSASFMGGLEADGFEISFEEGSNIGSIDDEAFAGMYGVSKIDLSNCVKLESIGVRSFRNSFNGTYDTASGKLSSVGVTTITLPGSLKSIGIQAFQISINVPTNNMMESLFVPASVMEVGDKAFDSVAQTIVFVEGSSLINAGNMIADIYDSRYHIDLSGCINLETVDIRHKTTLPSGIYDIQIKDKVLGTNLITNKDRIVYSYDSTGRLLIDSDDMVINKKLLDGDYKIIVDEDNTCFNLIDGLLVMNVGDHNTVVGIDSEQKHPVITDSSIIDGISEGAFRGSTVKTLRLGCSLSIADSILNGCRDVDLFILDDPKSITDLSLNGVRNLSVFLGKGVDRGISTVISSSDSVFLDVLDTTAASSLYVPMQFSDSTISIDTISVEGDMIILDGLTLGNGYALYDVDIKTDSEIRIIDHDTLVVILHQDEDSLTIVAKDRTSTPSVLIAFDGNGGDVGGSQWVSISIPVGATLLDSEIPVFIKGGYQFTNWIDINGNVWDGYDVPLMDDLYLVAHWEKRMPAITVGTIAGDVLVDSISIDRIEVDRGSDVEFTFVPYPGFQIANWVLNGVDTGKKASEPLTIGSVEDDCIISVSYIYSSPSSGLESIVNIDLPNTDELNNLVKVSELGGVVDTSSMLWNGHSSVPLIVDEKVYFRSGSNLYMAESDTGYILKSVKSRSLTAFYHYLGYGDGLVIDYATNTIYDTNLDFVCTMPDVSTLYYNDGFFYTSGSEVKRFSSQDCREVNGGIVQMKTIGTMDNVYTSYGITKSVFVGDYLYRVYSDKTERGIVGMNINTGETGYKKLDSLTARYMDDGWLSYSDGTLYLTGYTQGLFGSVACEGDNVLAFVNVDGLSFGEEFSYTLNDEHSFMSEFLVYENKGFVNSGGTFYVFEIGGSGVVGETRTVTMMDKSVKTAFSHGSMVMNTNEVDGGFLYFYVIPYQTNEVTMSVVKYPVDGYFGVSSYTSRLPTNYNSQAVRSDVDGRMIWYNDSGHIYTYTTPEKNVYFFLIQDGSSARWYESYGATAADALAALGRNVVTLNSIDGLATVNGKAVSDSWSINVLTDLSDKTKAGMIGKYGWVKLDNLYSNAHDIDHYYIITDSSTLPSSSTTYTYAVEGGLRTYSFADNIGGRDIIGKELIRAEMKDTVTIRFYDGEKEFIDSVLIGKKGGKVAGSFPSIYKYGMIAEWKDVNGEVVTLPTTFNSDQKYQLDWAVAPATYDIKLNPNSTDKTRVTFGLEITRNFGLEDLSDANLYIVGYYNGSDGKRFISTMSKIVIDDGKATSVVSLSSDDLVDISFRIIRGSISDTSYNNYGSAYWSEGVGA